MSEIIECISCKQKLRIPKNYSIIEITCPKCKTTWKLENKNKTENKNYDKNNKNLQEDIKKIICNIRTYIPKVGVFGNSGVGKSSLCNALFGQDVAKISDVEACTREPQEILIKSNDGQGGIILVDVPGIGEDPAHQIEYTELYKKLAPELDLILWAIKADDRNYASALDAYHSVCNTKNSPPIVFVITQTDKTNDVEDWNHDLYEPGESQKQNIINKEHDIFNRFRFNKSAIHVVSVAVSKKGKNYNLQELVERVVEVLPNEKKYSFTREAKEENVSIDAKKIVEKGIWDSVKSFFGENWYKVQDAATQLIAEKIKEEMPKIIEATKEALEEGAKKLFQAGTKSLKNIFKK